MEIPVVQVDAFAEAPFAGNPAAVCPPAEPGCPESRLQQVAAEMALSETAFLRRRDDGGFGLRWFTPTTEIELCGHATLAAAHVLWERELLAPARPAVFHTRSGRLTADRGGDGWIWLDLPPTPTEPGAVPDGLVEALGADVDAGIHYVGSNGTDELVLLEDGAAVRDLDPDLAALAEVPTRGVIVTARAGSEDDRDHDFVSRFFAPRVGIPEDPVTGSAHCTLGAFWAERLGRRDLVGYQASPRGGVVRVQPSEERVRIGGRAVTVLRGALVL